MRDKLVTFDLDDTLWCCGPVIDHAEQRLQDWLWRRVPQLGQVTREHIAQWKAHVLAEQPQIAYSVTRVRYQVLMQAFLQAGESAQQAQQSAEEAFQFFLNERQKVSVFPETKQVLTRLRQQGWLVGALSNGNADVRRVGLEDYFDFALSADVLGVGKPDPAVFRAAQALAGVLPGRAVHVGDNPLDDIDGALKAGWRAVWFNPAGHEWTADQHPDADLRQLAQLPETLERLLSR